MEVWPCGRVAVWPSGIRTAGQTETLKVMQVLVEATGKKMGKAQALGSWIRLGGIASAMLS